MSVTTESDSIELSRKEDPKPKVPITFCGLEISCPQYIESRCCWGCTRYEVCRSHCLNSPEKCGQHCETKKDLTKLVYAKRMGRR